MKLNKTDEKVLKYFLKAKSPDGLVDPEKLEIPKSISDGAITDSIMVLEQAGLIRTLSKDYMYQMEPDGLRYFDTKKSNRNSLFFWKFVYTPSAFVLGVIVTLLIDRLLQH